MLSNNPLRNKDYLLGKRLQHLRIKRGMTQEKLAEISKVSVTHLSMIEAGKSTPSLKLIYRIADKLDVKLKEIFDF